jgi:excinuclease ABC subunit A
VGSGDDGWIDVVGARPHNLQGVRVRVPKGVIVVFTGVSDSGKTSLLMNTIRAEAQLRYLEGITPFVRQFVTPRDRPKVDRIDELPPTLAVDQRHPGRSALSSLATIKAVGDYLRLVYARLPPLAADWDGSLGAVLEPAQLDPGSPDGWCPSCHDSGGWARAEADLVLTRPDLPLLAGASPWFTDVHVPEQAGLPSLASHFDIDLDTPWQELPEAFRHAVVSVPKPAAAARRPGRCRADYGVRQVDMHFLPDVWVTCYACEGRRYPARGARGDLARAGRRRDPGGDRG